MKIEFDAKFKIGDVVTIKNSSTKLFIEQIHSITCTAGTQVNYEGFIGVDKELWGKTTSCVTQSFPKERVIINEIMLEKIAEEENV